MSGIPHMRRLMMAAAVLVVGLLVGVPASPALAAPNDEGGTPTLRETLEAASKGYTEAKAALDSSRKRQAELTQQAESAEKQLAQLSVEVSGLAVAAYQLPRAGKAVALLDSDSPDSLLDRLTTLDVITAREDRKLHQLTEVRAQLRDAKAAIDAEVVKQQEQLTLMAKKKADAEKALAAVGGQATGGYVSATSPAAEPAPRNPDGSWPGESCTVDDPTTSGCITPRTLHALQQAKSDGFTRYVSCYRPYNDGGEHPKGRACDFASSATGFAGAATGGDRTYGNNLAAYFVRNASNLAVLYVIWYCQIWMPSTGWRAYSCNGSPSSDHTNHVHLSVI